MSGESNEDVLRRMKREVINAHDADAARRYFSESYRNNVPGRAPGLRGLQAALSEFFIAFPDVEEDIVLIFSKGDLVASYATLRATHKGPFGGLPATGRQVSFSIQEISRIQAGKIHEQWVSMDLFGLMAQLGAAPPGVMPPVRKSYLVPPGDRGHVELGGVGAILKVAGAETGGAFSVVEHPVEPGRLVPPHVHAREDELSYVLEGEVGVRVGEEVFLARSGSYVFKPRGVPHTFWNAGPKPARILEIIAPAGFEKFFDELAALKAGGKATPEAIEALAKRYGNTFRMAWVPELIEKYRVRLLD